MRRILAILALASLCASPAVLARKNLGAAPDAPAPAIPLKVRALDEVALHPEREASAEVVALNESRIAAEIPGRIEAVAVEVGQTLARGALVARIDCRDHALARDRARAALAAAGPRASLAAQQLERARVLKAKGFFSDEALAARETEQRVLEAEVAQARAQRDAAERTVEKCVVRAPFDAVVRERLGRVGELAAAGTPLATLIDTGRIEVAAQVQVRDAGSLREAKAVRFVGDGIERALRLERVSPAIDRVARAVEARLRFEGDAAASGAQGRIVWRDPRAWVAPALVVRRAGQLGIFVEREGRARFHPLPGAQEGRPARVDLPGTTRVVVSGQLALKDGAPLEAAAK